MAGKKLIAAVAVAGIAVAAAFGVKTYLAGNAGETADRFLNKTVAHVGTAEYEQASRSLTGDVSMKNVTFTPNDGKPLQIDELVVHRYDYDNEIPNFVHVSAKGVQIDMSQAPDPRAQMFLTMLGYEKLVADVELEYEHEPESKGATLKLREHLKDAVELNLDLDVGNFEPKTAVFSYQNAELNSARLSIRNDSLVERGLKLGSQSMGVTEDELLQQIRTQIDKRIAMSKTETEKDALQQVKDFLERRGTLTLAVEPEQPIALSELRNLDPDAAPERLQVQITSH